jgi:hypothetical protein
MPEPRYKVVNNQYIELTQSELDELAAQAETADLDLSMVRADRNARLASTDWTQLGDASLGDHTAEEWRTYRQALKDIPQNHTRVSTVVWPETPPEEAARLLQETAQAAYDAVVESGGTIEEAEAAREAALA